jgi:protein SCO1/2
MGLPHRRGALAAATLCALAIQAGGRSAATWQREMGGPPPRAAAAATPAAAPAAAPQEGAPPRLLPPWPDVPLVDQDGRAVHFYSDLVRGKRVAINFVFTTCTTICPPMGANFQQLQTLLGARAGADVRLLSVSIDPLTDTPERLKAWGARFHAGPGWTLVTGPKAEVDRLLKAMGVFTSDPSSHAPLLLLGDDATGRWTRAYGLAPPAKIVQLLDGLASPGAAPSAGPRPRQQPRPVADNGAAAAGAAATGAASPAATVRPAAVRTAAYRTAAGQPGESAAHHYFTDVELIDQDGQPRRLYSDLLAGKTVVVDAFFTSCTGSCPVMSATLAKLQAALGDRLGRDLRLLSVSVDPRTDTPARLKDYAARLGARPGWYFLTGNQQNVDFALHKLGQYTEQKEAHTNVLIVGNERTGLWKKVFGLGKAEDILAIVRGVLDDRGTPGSGG